MKRWWMAAMITGALVAPATAHAQEAAADDPLDDIALDMQLVVGDLTRFNTGETTQETQTTIVAKLDDLIKKLEQECEACRSGSVNPNPNRPAQDSTIRQGPGGSGDLHAARKNGRDWGELPAKERDRILQSLTEGFPRHYQKLLERYYRRLADEEPVTDTEAESADAEPAQDNGEAEDAVDKETDDASADKTAARSTGGNTRQDLGNADESNTVPELEPAS